MFFAMLVLWFSLLVGEILFRHQKQFGRSNVILLPRAFFVRIIYLLKGSERLLCYVSL